MAAVASAEKSTNVRTVTPVVPLSLRTLSLGLRVGDKVAPALTARVAEHVFFTPRRHERPRREWQLLASGRSFRLRIGAERVLGWRWGNDEAPTVLLVHGWEGRGVQLGHFVEPLLARGYRVITFDAPAHGASSGKKTNVFAFAETIRAIADEHGPISGIIAHSLGAAATSLALRAGLSCDRVVYLAPWCTLSRAVDAFGDRIGLSERVTGRMREDIEKSFNVPWEEVDGDAIAPAMRTPLLVVHDRDDADVPLAEGERLATAWPQAKLHVTATLGHRRILRAPSVIEESVDFLAGPAPRQPTNDWQRLIAGPAF